MNQILKVENLSKSYINKKALNNISLTLEKGKVLGLLGPNGSGKTTLIKVIAGLIKSYNGTVLINDECPGVSTKSIISYLPDVNHLYKWMKVRDALNFFIDFYDDFDKDKADELLEFMKLNKDSKINTLSKGMLERLNLTLVMSRKAKLYVLDEPIAGVDPVAREKILDTIINNFSGDSSMLITTHLVKDIERIFDDVAFISDGDITLYGNAEELRIDRGKSIDELYREVFE